MLRVISVDKLSVQPSDCVVLLVSVYMVRCEAVLVVVMAVVIVFLYSVMDLVLRLNTI